MDIKNNILTSEMRLPIPVYQDWFNILSNNKAEEARTLLSSVPFLEKQTLINGTFGYDDDSDDEYFDSSNWRFSLPIHVAFAMASKDVVKILLDSHADIHAVNHNKFNVLHVCIVVGFKLPHLEDEICKTIKWLAEEIPAKDLSQLLFEENTNGLRPLEFATQQGCLKIMKTLLETPGHVTKTKTDGLIVRRYHDVTEYETGSRHSKNPINMFPYLDERRLQQIDYSHELLSPLIISWITAKMKSNVFMIIFWVIIRFAFYTLFLFIDSDVSWILTNTNRTSDSLCQDLSVNVQPKGLRITLFIIVLVYIAGALIGDIFEMALLTCGPLKYKWKAMNGTKIIIGSTFFYFVTNTIVELLVLFNFTIYVLIETNTIILGETLMQVGIFTRATIPVLMMWSMLYFFQLVPYISSSVLSIQRMYVELIRFSVIMILATLPFVHAFGVFLQLNTQSGTCIEDFSSLYKGFYSLFRVMLNSYDLTSLQVNNAVSLQFLHMMFVFTVAILVMNFLIAVMSSKANQIADHEEIYLKLNQLALIVRFEDREYILFKWLYKYFRRCGFLCKNDKIYIVSEVCTLEN